MSAMVRSATSSVSTVVVHPIATGRRPGVGAFDSTTATGSDAPTVLSLNIVARDQPVTGSERDTVFGTHRDGQHWRDTPKLKLNATLNGTSTVRALPKEYYNAFLSKQAKNRKPNSIRELLPLELTPGVISLLAGKPNSFSFPITGITIDVRSAADTPDTPGKPLTISNEALADGLQYGITAGYKPLVDWLEGLQSYSHGRKSHEGWRLSMASGSQDALYKAFNAVVSPGDSVLVESPVYAGILPILNELEANIIPIESDSDGLKASVLRTTLENWPASKPGPKALYTVPFGSNPAGMTTSEDRRREVLALSAKYNFLVFEDDPYYYLYYGDLPRPKSYFALEIEMPEVGRVMRFDSMSKILSAGMRIGFASGPIAILDAMDMHTALANMQVSSFTQVIAHAIFESWGYDKFRMHTEVVSASYRKRRDIFDAALRSTLHGLVEWSPPVSGLFFWFRLLLNGVDEDSEDIIRDKAFKKGVLAMPGAPFMPDGRRSSHVRASFSLLEPDEIYEALRRLREVLLEARAQTAAE